MDELTRRAERGDFSSFALAIAHTGLGETGLAIEAVHRAIDRRDIFLPEIVFDPLLHPLRNDPRFRRVEERIGLHRKLSS